MLYFFMQDNPNVISARSFVGWFNGLPQDKEVRTIGLYGKTIFLFCISWLIITVTL